MTKTTKKNFDSLVAECESIIANRTSGRVTFQAKAEEAKAALADAEKARDEATEADDYTAAAEGTRVIENAVTFYEEKLAACDKPPMSKEELAAKQAIVDTYARELTDELRTTAESIVTPLVDLATDYREKMEEVEETTELLRRTSMAEDLLGSVPVIYQWPHYGWSTPAGQGWQRIAFTQAYDERRAFWCRSYTDPVRLAIWNLILALTDK